jgi:hyperosmotically inducible protein
LGTALAETAQRISRSVAMNASSVRFPMSRAALGALALAAASLLGACEQRSNGAAPVTAGTQLDDAVITTKVKTAIMTDADARGADTSVQTRKGEVMLSGFADSQAQIDRQVALAKGVEGVQSVDNKLMVKNGTSTAGNVLDDSVVTVKVKTALMSDPATKGNEIAVTTHKGVVQLSGFVDSAADQERATTLARNVEGVQNVLNETTLKK